MNFVEISKDFFQKNFNENISMSVDFKQKKLFYPENIKIYRDSIKNFSQNENFVVFECVHRLLQKNYLPQDIEIEKTFKIGHTQKSGRADIFVSKNQKTLFIIECKTAGAEFKKELENLNLDGGQLFSYRQQDISCQWLILYTSDFVENKIFFDSKSVSCNEEIYKNASTVQDFFKIWSENFNKNIADDVIFHDETVAYKIGVKPLRKKNLIEFDDTSIVNIYEEILRHNSVTNKQNAFDALLELFICKLADESQKNLDDEVDFQFKFGSDNFEIFIDRLQKLYHQGMEKFMRIPTTYTPLSVVENLLQQNNGANRKNLENLFKQEFNKLKFYTPNIFNFIKVLNREIFYMNGKIVREVVNKFKNFKIIGAKNLQTLGDLFEQLLDKGFKQDEGQFFTPIPITRFIWDSLPLEKIISAENLPKIIDYACGAGHFLTQGFEAINDFFTKNNISPPIFWENEKLFGIEKNDRLSTVSKISLFMHGADKGKIKFGDGLENFPDEGITAESFDILVSNPPYSIKDFKQYLQIKNKFETLEKISQNGKEIETLFVERISQLLKAGGIAAVILPSSILNKDGGSFIVAREKILQNFYIRAIVEFGSKTFSATGTKTNILFLEKISKPPEKFQLFADSVNIIFSQKFSVEWDDEEIFSAWLKKIKIEKKIYEKFIRRERNFFEWKNDAYFGEYFSEYVGRTPKVRTFLEKFGEGLFRYIKINENTFWVDFIHELENLNRKFYDFAQEIEREKIQYFAMTYTQKTLIITAPDENSAQEKFLGYSWSNRKGDEGIKIKAEGGMLYDKNNRRAENKLAYAVRKIFYGEEVEIADAQNFYNYYNLSDLIDFSGVNFTKIIKLTKKIEQTYGGKFPLKKLKDTAIKPLEYGSGTAATDFDGKIRYIRITDINDDGKLNKNLVSPEKFDEKFILNDGDILFARSGATVGKTFLYKKIYGDAIFAGYLIRYVADTKIILPEYVFQFTRTDFYKNFVENTKKGMTQPNINAQDYGNLKIPVPTLEEQKKIVLEFAAIDEKISDCEEKINLCEASIKNKFLEMFGGIEEKISLEKISEIIQGTSPKSEFYNENGEGLGFYQGKKDFGEIYLNEPTIWTKNFVKISIQNDILMSVRAPVGDVNINNFEKICIGRGLAAIRIENNFLRNFVFYYLYYNKEKISGHRGSTFDSISGDEIKKFLIPNPPKEKQEKFAEFVKSVEDEKVAAQIHIEELKLAREKLAEKYFR